MTVWRFGKIDVGSAARWVVTLVGLGVCGALQVPLRAEAQPATNAAMEVAPPKLAPPYGELPPTFWEQNGGLVIVGGVVLLVLLAVVIWMALKPKSVVQVPAEVRAQEELKSLKSLPEDGATLSRISQALRRYFIAAFALPPGEYTTTDFCRMIQAHEKVGPKLGNSLTAFLQECDERKFAAQTTGSTRAAMRAWELVQQAEMLRQPEVVGKS